MLIKLHYIPTNIIINNSLIYDIVVVTIICFVIIIITIMSSQKWYNLIIQFKNSEIITMSIVVNKI